MQLANLLCNCCIALSCVDFCHEISSWQGPSLFLLRRDCSLSCSVPVKLEMRSYFLSYLDRCSRTAAHLAFVTCQVPACSISRWPLNTRILLACSRGPALEPFVVTSLVQLLCRTTKLCWFDDDAFRNIVDDAKQFLEKVSVRYPTCPTLSGHASDSSHTWQCAAIILGIVLHASCSV